MTKRLCKMNRKQIADSLGEIHRLVSDTKYVCRSCARSSSSKASLCKPSAIPPKSCQNQPIEQQKNCALLAEALPKTPKVIPSPDKAQAIRKVVERVKEKVAQPQPSIHHQQTEVMLPKLGDLPSKRVIKRAKKTLKKYYKQQKKLLKLAKKQQKLLKKQQKLETKLPNTLALAATISEMRDVVSGSNIH
ncbi:hypothetical protein [Vibrio sinaloensis]|uniref:hypothetical protein n=1 Tax=Vibrio TaxID=662 RepID=UPI0022AFD95E|nr:hypothetical protein [Vibrio sinaloensis]MCZ4295921.1 hypothetical protein [Vibrio sinaloensis]